MNATCAHCGSSHIAEPPAGQPGDDAPFEFSCPSCGKTTPVLPAASAHVEGRGAGIPLRDLLPPRPPGPDDPLGMRYDADMVPDDDTEETQPPPTEEAPTEHDEAALVEWAEAMSAAARAARQQPAPPAEVPPTRGVLAPRGGRPAAEQPASANKIAGLPLEVAGLALFMGGAVLALGWWMQ